MYVYMYVYMYVLGAAPLNTCSHLYYTQIPCMHIDTHLQSTCAKHICKRHVQKTCAKEDMLDFQLHICLHVQYTLSLSTAFRGDVFRGMYVYMYVYMYVLGAAPLNTVRYLLGCTVHRYIEAGIQTYAREINQKSLDR